MLGLTAETFWRIFAYIIGEHSERASSLISVTESGIINILLMMNKVQKQACQLVLYSSVFSICLKEEQPQKKFHHWL